MTTLFPTAATRCGLLLFILILASGVNAQTASDTAELTKLLNDFLAGASRNDRTVSRGTRPSVEMADGQADAIGVPADAATR